MEYDSKETTQDNINNANNKLKILFHKVCGKEYLRLVKDVIYYQLNTEIQHQYKGQYEMQEAMYINYDVLALALSSDDKSFFYKPTFITNNSLQEQFDTETKFMQSFKNNTVHGIYLSKPKKTIKTNEIIEGVLSYRLISSKLQIGSDNYLQLSSETGTFFLVKNNESLTILIHIVQRIQKVIGFNVTSLNTYLQRDEFRNLESISEIANYIFTNLSKEKEVYNSIYKKLSELVGVVGMYGRTQCKFYKYCDNNQVSATNLNVGDCKNEIPPKFIFVPLD
jgi:hypothetical protein